MARMKKVKTGEEFVFVNGATAGTVAQLRNELKKLNDEQFHHHVNEQKNDFYNWLNDCVDPALAQKVQGLMDRDKLIQALA